MRFDEPLLSAAEEVELARAVEAGVLAAAALAGEDVPRLDASRAELTWLVRAGEAARERLLLANCRLVMTVAHSHARRLGLPADELFQEGFLGLAEAVDRFDHARGVKFSTFAMTRITSRVLSACRTRCGEVAGTEWAVRARGAAALRTVPLAGEEHELPLPDAGAAAALEAVLDGAVPSVAELVAGLPPEERAVIVVRFGADAPTLAQTAERLGRSAATVRRTELRALARLRERVEPLAA